MSDSNLCFVMLELSPFLHPMKDMVDECGLHDAIVGWIDKIAGVGYIVSRLDPVCSIKKTSHRIQSEFSALEFNETLRRFKRL